MVNGNVSTEYVNLAPISDVERDELAAGRNPNSMDWDDASDLALGLTATDPVEDGDGNFVVEFTLDPLVNGIIDFGDGEFGVFSSLNHTGHPALDTVEHVYPPDDATYAVVVKANGCTDGTAEVIIGSGTPPLAASKRKTKKA